MAGSKTANGTLVPNRLPLQVTAACTTSALSPDSRIPVEDTNSWTLNWPSRRQVALLPRIPLVAGQFRCSGAIDSYSPAVGWGIAGGGRDRARRAVNAADRGGRAGGDSQHGAGAGA
jgi:hypothetical protein